MLFEVSENTATVISMIAGTLSIIAAIFAYLVVDAIDKRQEETSKQVKLGRFTAPPPSPDNLKMADVVPVAPATSNQVEVWSAISSGFCVTTS